MIPGRSGLVSSKATGSLNCRGPLSTAYRPMENFRRAFSASGIKRFSQFTQDECTFYYTNEYYETTSSLNWRTRIGYFKFAQCTAPPRGNAHFVVTVCEGGAPLANAWVSVDGRLYGATIANGTYDAVLTAGSHTYSVSKPTFGTATGNFNITNGQTTNVPVCLSGATPTPTPTPTASPTPTATPTATLPPSPTPTPTARPTPVPRPRPTPAPRP